MKTANVATCAEEILHLLHEHGVEYLFLNPGTDSAPLQEAVAALQARGVAIPRVVTCSFESVALAAAHGYWQLTRRPQAVFVHVDVGTQNLGAMVHDVLRDGAGVVVLAGKTPYGTAADAVGGRSNEIHWRQDVADQAGIVRGYAKWTSELTRSADTSVVVGRALQVAAGGRPGMAYLMVSRDVLMEPASPLSRRATRFARPSPPAVEPAALSRLAELLVTAQRPVIVTSRLGRSPAAARSLAELAAAASVPVGGRPEAVNLVTAHPMRVAPSETDALVAEADLVVCLDCDVPWIPRAVTPPPDATVAQIELDPVHADMPLWAFPVDLAITADPAVAVAQLARAVRERGGVPADLSRARRAWMASATGRSDGVTPAPRPARGVPEAADVVAALDQVLRPADVVVEEAVTNSAAVAGGLSRAEPGTLCTPGGPGLGWALGASVGVKLARPADRVVAVVGDGAFMFGVPTAALCLAAEAGAPFVTIVLNNDGYRASRLPVTDLYPDGAAAASAEVPGTRFRRPPDFVALAEACGAHGERVTDRSQLVAALTRALDATDAGRCAVVDVVTPR
ncbi:thiamine pyrophosphate-requiring protein [Jiangella asiatica]|uniref:Thiamine pyrophosphate-requiring protein n=1 Tax=Jiangella asiatica TaxID=2530372 RepID=A0A4R5D4U9_9ACTN|nr:thiamine pyrophosphate-requiring protein [Jiangella asiatica]TDE08459.1 thiamine pyrophosphate-requiring protein [Jiangella asiatica]